MSQLDLTVTFRSDWAVGSGQAQHDAADALIRRDAHGLPYVPGKTLRGILRDATENIALGLGNGAFGAWDEWTRYLWGSDQSVEHDGRAGIINVPSALIGGAARACLLSDLRLITASVTTRSSVRIDSSTSIAEHGMLRTLERGRRGWVLDGSLDLEIDETLWSQAPLWPARFLLAAAARRVERLGSDRRRGAGAVDLTLPALDAEWPVLLQRATETAVGQIPSAPRSVPRFDPNRTATSPWAARSSESPWQRFLVTLTTIDPVLVRAQTLGNAVVSHTFIPGATLLPLVSQALGGAGEAIASGSLIVTDATPGPADADRSLPTPLCLHRAKVAAEDERRLAVNVMRRGRTAGGGSARQTVGIGDYTGPGPQLATDTVIVHRTPMITTMHNTIEDDLQRPGLNGLYSYEAIAPGTALTFEVLLRGAAPVDPSALLPATARVGGSQSAEYGRVRLACRKVTASPGLAGTGGIAAGEPFAIWLTSAMIPDEGQDAAALLSTLGGALATTLTLDTDRDSPSLMARSVRRDSWQARWNLLRPSLVAFEAGTIVRVTAADDIDEVRITTLETEGAGRRRSEGFGRILVRPPLLDHDQITLVEPQAAGAARPAAGSDDPAPDWLLATRIAACSTAFEDECWRFGRAKPLDARLTRAQVGRLRSAAEQSLSSGSLTALQTWATSIDASQQRRVWGDDMHLAGPKDLRTFLAVLDPDGQQLAPLLAELPESDQHSILVAASCMLVLARAQAYTVDQSPTVQGIDQ